MKMASTLARCVYTRRALFTVVILLLTGAGVIAQTPTSVDESIAFLRQIDPAKVKPDDEESVAKKIDAAWTTITQAGAPGRARVKAELTKPGQSDYFKLNLSALLWTLGHLDEAETIASVWRTTKLDAQPNYVFYPSFQAAMTQDARALPMMRVVLGNQKVGTYVSLHALEVKWPLTIEFIWGSFGPKSLTELLNVLKTSHSSEEIQSAMFLLSEAQSTEALPLIRQVARTAEGQTRGIALNALGEFGDPQDYDFLIAGLHSKDPEEVFWYADALYEFEDLRAVPEMIPLLDSPDVKVRREAFAGLTHLLTSQSLDALIKYAQRARGDEKAEVEEYLQSELQEYKLTLAEYSRKTPQDKITAIEAIRHQREANRFELPKNQKGLTHAELVKAAEEWKKNHRLKLASSEMPLDTRQLLSGATVDDIPLLLEVKAAVLARLSDECLYEVKSINSVIQRVGRSRYRKEVGITAKAEAR
jgi:hypothetical protein